MLCILWFFIVYNIVYIIVFMVYNIVYIMGFFYCV